MSQFSIIGTPLYQWEKGRRLKVTPLTGMSVDVLHFSNYGDTEALVVKPKEENGVYTADIPNIFLQSDKNIVVYSVNVSEEKVETLRGCVLSVRKRAKPADYVYTETEVLSYATLDQRLAILEKGGISDEKLAESIDKYLTENPPEVGLDEEAVGAIVDEKTAKAIAGKLDNSGHAPDMFLGTDENGNVVTKDAPSGGICFESGDLPEDCILQIDPNGEALDASFISDMIAEATAKKQDTFDIGDGLKLVDGVLSLDLEAWQGGEY